MTGSMRGWPRFVIVVALALFAWTHHHALGMSGFADDLGLLVDLSQRAQHGTLLADVFAHISQPLWPGSTMWRPLPYASFALDAQLWGADAGLWRVTNLALHIACAGVTGLICCDVTQRVRAGAVGFAVFLLIPWSPEVVIWLAGRFDGWATLGVLLALWAALRSDGFDRWCALSLVSGACAYASKESALMLPVWIAVIALQASHRETASDVSLKAVLHQTLKKRGILLVTHLLVAATYLFWRATLFPASSLNVYAAGPQLNPTQLAGQFWAHLKFPLGLASLAPVAAWIVAISFVSLVAIVTVAGRGKQKSFVVAGAFFIATVVTAIAIYIPAAPGEGDGYRLYYLATVGIALTVAGAATSSSRATLAAIVVLLGAMAFWQQRVTDEWLRASREMQSTEVAFRSAAIAMPSQDYGLVLLSDHLGHVPFARNAQGALPTLAGLPMPTVDVLSRLVVFTPPQIDEWHRLAQEGVVRKITARSDSPPNPTQYFCFDPRTQKLQTLGFWSTGMLEDWRRKWRESVDAMCPPTTALGG